MRTKHVVVEPYNPKWKADFEAIKSEVAQALGEIALSIEHVGSSSVEDLSAKPIIDIDVVIKEEDVSEAIARLSKIGYQHEGNLGIAGREAFCYDEEQKKHLQVHHLYVCPENSAELKRHIAFRDYLRTHEAERDKYSRVKAEAARLFPNDIEGYIAHKSSVIEKIYKELGL